ncbi:MAG TPA: nuclear transport factor 2 family protein [Polyangia bacterium]|nr:nuclear transport factor 2 family protein [Polyangia bacterium]
MKIISPTLPKPIEKYLRSVNAGALDDFATSFADDARVKDLEREIRGLDAIKEWARRDIFGVNARLDALRVTEGNGRTVVTVKIDGTFDRTGLPDPLLMDHAFTLVDGRITELKVTFTA